MAQEKKANSDDENFEQRISSLESRIQSFEVKKSNDREQNEQEQNNTSYRNNVAVVIIGIFVLLIVGYFGYIIFLFRDKEKQIVEGITNHGLAAIGLPIAAITSLTLVLLLEEVFGQTIKVKAIGFEFEGAAGPIILWILGFLAITIAIKSVW